MLEVNKKYTHEITSYTFSISARILLTMKYLYITRGVLTARDTPDADAFHAADIVAWQLTNTPLTCTVLKNRFGRYGMSVTILEFVKAQDNPQLAKAW